MHVCLGAGKRAGERADHDLPRNAMGKVQKNLLRETYRQLFVPA